MTNIKEEVLKELGHDTGFYIEDIEKAIDLTQQKMNVCDVCKKQTEHLARECPECYLKGFDKEKQKMIEQEKRLLNKINEIFNNKEQSFTDASLRVWTIVQNRLEELKSSLEEKEKAK